MKILPDNYLIDLMSYEDLILKINLLGFKISDLSVLNHFHRLADYYWFVTVSGNFCFMDLNGEKVNNIETLNCDFDCRNVGLTSLEGCPRIINGAFDCSSNFLTSLKGGPRSVYRWYDCSYNELDSFEGWPEEVGGSFYCERNKIFFKHPPKGTKIYGEFYPEYLKQI